MVTMVTNKTPTYYI